MKQATDLGPAPPRSLIPEGLLELPETDFRPYVHRFEAGMAFDLPLRRLSTLSGAIDGALAVRLARLRRSRGFLRLGYARFGDYTRERLDLAERTAYDLARLGGRLAELSLLAAALREGRLGWTAASEVARVASNDDEASWVAKAERLSIRKLRDEVRATLAGRRAAKAGPASAAATEKGEGEAPADDDEPPTGYRTTVRVPTAWLWETAIDLCGHVAGADLSRHEGPEYLLADFLSGCDRSETALAFHGDSHGDSTDSTGSAVDGLDIEAPRRGGRAGNWPDWWDESWVADELGPAATHAEVSSETRATLRILEAPVPDDPFALDESLRALVRSRSALDLDLARLLRQVHSLGLARHLGFPGFAAYAEARLGISPRRARFLVALDRGLTRLPLVEKAVREGRLGTVAAQTLCRVARARQTEGAWLERALRVPVARLRREVAWAEGRDRMGRVRGFPLPPPSGRLATALDEMSEALGQVVRPTSAIAVSGRGDRPGEGASSSAIESEAESHGDVDRRGEATNDSTITARWPTFATREDVWVAFELRLRRSALPLWHEARRQVALAGGKGHATDDTVIRTVALAFLAAYLPLWLAEIESGDPIALRERFRCAVPGCTVRSGSAHHIRFRSQGGGDDPSNLTFLCYRHHLVALHELGSLKVSGRAPDALRFELGTRPEGGPLEVYQGGERERTKGRAPAAPRRPAVPGSAPALIPPRVSFPFPRPDANLGPCPPPP